MNFTDKQRKMFWAIAVIAGVIYFGPSIISAYYQALHSAPVIKRREPPSGPRPPQATPLSIITPVPPMAESKSVAQEPAAQFYPPQTPLPSPVISATSTPPISGIRYLPPLTGLTGFWRGRAAIRGRGICDMHFELRAKDDTDKFTGYSTLTCYGTGPLVARPNAVAMALNQNDPESAILTGISDNDSLKFEVDKVVGTDSSGCAPTSLTMTPFGAGRVAVEWHEVTCSGGRMLMARSPK